MSILLTLIHIVVCLILIVVILIQGGRGQGLTGPSFVSGNVQSLFGTRAADFLTKATSISAVVFLFSCIGLNILESRKSRSLLEATRTQQSPVDIDAIKKALEKVKSEQLAKVSETTTSGGEGAASAVSETAGASDTLTATAGEVLKGLAETSVPEGEAAPGVPEAQSPVPQSTDQAPAPAESGN